MFISIQIIITAIKQSITFNNRNLRTLNKVMVWDIYTQMQHICKKMSK